MSGSRLPYYFLIVVLLAGGFALTLHRHIVFHVPWMPGETRTVWSIEASVEFEASGQPITATLARPQSQPGYVLLNESAASPGYGLNFLTEADSPFAEWTVRSAKGAQRLFYRVELMEDSVDEQTSTPPELPSAPTHLLEEPFATAVNQIATVAYRSSADAFSFTRQLTNQFKEDNPDQNVRLILTNYEKNALPALLVGMLQEARVPVSLMYGLQLQDGRRRQTLIPMLKVWEGERYKIFPLPGHSGGADLPLLLWEQTGKPVLDVVGGQRSNVTFSIIRREDSIEHGIRDQLSRQDSLIGFSIHSLPLEEQAMFQTILLLPIGALVVCILRILIGIKTSGTFMPVLIALAFIQTQLITGVIGFLLIVSVGLIIRGYLSRLNLLLVARITAVIITVIVLISVFSVMSYSAGLTEGLKITFFPMIILAWTIERMSILWEEEGWMEVLSRGGGSLMTAVIAYLAMNNPLVRHLMFNFFGLQAVIMAIILLLGSYKGYRLLELYRFREFGKED